jgi:hypothetical protein
LCGGEEKMAKRMIDTKFWDDPYTSELDPVEKLLFLYYLTNPLVKISGIYEIRIKQVAFDTGIDKEMVMKINERFERDEKIYFKDSWVMIKNFIKHQSLNPSVIKGIERELNDVPNHIIDRLGTDWVQAVGNLTKLNLTKLNLTKPNVKKSGGEKKSNKVLEVVNHFFEVKGWGNKDKEFYEKNKIVYARFTRPAKDLLSLCDDDLVEAKSCVDKVGAWAISRKLDWSIETIFKKWMEIDTLKPAEKKPYYKNKPMFQQNGKWKVILPDGTINDYAGKQTEIEWK